MMRILERYKECLRDTSYRRSLLGSLLALFAALALNAYAIEFATDHASNGVTDIILSNTPALDVDGLFVYGTFVLLAIMLATVLGRPKRIPFAFFAVAIFFCIRSAFTSMTHLGPFAPITTEFGAGITKAFFGGDYFFSGHVGLPFLGALSFWANRPLRLLYLGLSLVAAFVVLSGHLHYSIDVFSAFFITYTILHIAQWLCPKEWTLFSADI